MNDSFVLFTKIDEVVSELTTEQKGQLFQAILDYQKTGVVPEMDKFLRVVFIPIKHDMDYCTEQREKSQRQKSEAGKKSAEVRSAKGNTVEQRSTKGNTVEHNVMECNEDVNVNANVNDNSNSYINTIHTDEPRPAAGRECVKSGPPSKPPKEDPQKKKKSDVMEERFERFWSAYPKKVGKGDARKAFLKVNPSDALLGRMVTAVAAASTSYQWQKNKGQFIPNPATWLNQQRWEDEVPPDIGRPDSRAAPQVKTAFSNFAEHEYTDEDEAVELELMREGVLGGGN